MSSASDLNEDELFSISEDSQDSEEDAQRGGRTARKEDNEEDSDTLMRTPADGDLEDRASCVLSKRKSKHKGGRAPKRALGRSSPAKENQRKHISLETSEEDESEETSEEDAMTTVVVVVRTQGVLGAPLADTVDDEDGPTFKLVAGKLYGNTIAKPLVLPLNEFRSVPEGIDEPTAMRKDYTEPVSAEVGKATMKKLREFAQKNTYDASIEKDPKARLFTLQGNPYKRQKIP